MPDKSKEESVGGHQASGNDDGGVIEGVPVKMEDGRFQVVDKVVHKRVVA